MSYKHSIGASQIAAVLGLDPWTSPQDLWTEFVHGTKREQNEHMTRGLMLEDGLCNWWLYLEGIHPTQLSDAPQFFKQVKKTHAKYDWARATPDMVATVRSTGELVTVDVKCPANFKKWNESRNEFPVHYGLQVIWQIGVWHSHGINVHHGVLAAGPAFGKLLRFKVMPDPQLFELALKRAEEFLQHVGRAEPLPATFTQEVAQ